MTIAIDSKLTSGLHRPLFGRVAPSRVALLLVCALLSWQALSTEILPRPAGLEPDIAFWRRIFSEIDANQGLLHDNRHLGVVYAVLDLPPGAGNRELNRVYDKSKKHYRKILLQLAQTDRKNLSREQARVLALWPRGTSSAELRKASERLRVQQGIAGRFREGLVRSGLWLPHIRTSLKNAGVPPVLAAMPHVESSFDPNVYSQVGAAGLWQFTRSTGKHYLQVDHIVDERRDPFLSSEAAASLLKYNYSKLHSWPLAITAYNHGVTGMRRAVRTMGTDDIEQIVRKYDGRAFGFASRNFYVAFLAALDIERDVPRYLGAVKRQVPSADLVVTLPHYVSVDVLQKTFGIPEVVWKKSNPALMDTVWTGSKYIPKGFGLRIPQSAVKLSSENFLEKIPVAYRYQAQIPDLYHKVKPGEALSLIARRYDTTVGELVSWNGLKSSHRIRIGQVLRLPQSGQLP